MTIQFSTTLRNARADQIETTIGTAAKVEIRSGAQPANCAAADSGTLLAAWTLASDWAAAASGGSKSFSNTPIATTGSANGTAGHYRVKDNAGTTCHMQGSVTVTGGGGDMIVDNTSINSGQAVNITSWSITEGNA
jgi:hypothetical protein